MLPLCAPGDSYSSPWLEYGFSRCFLEMVGGISGLGVLYVFGLGAFILGNVAILPMPLDLVTPLCNYLQVKHLISPKG